MGRVIVDTSDFDVKWPQFEKTVERAIGLVIEELGKETRSSLAERTPVKTGRAAASWNASLNHPNPTTKPPSYLNPTGAVQDGEEDLENAKPEDVVYITNAIPYIDELNEGSSVQAPAGFVEATTLSIPAKVQEIVERVKRRL